MALDSVRVVEKMKCLLVLTILSLSILEPARADAKVSKELTYRYASIWSAAIRFIRADKEYPIRDKDKETGYILFVYPGQGSVKACKASLQLITLEDENKAQRVRVQLTIAHQPSYIELHVLEQLERKLREDYGDAPPPRRRKDPPKEDKKPTAPKKTIEGNHYPGLNHGQ